MTPGSCACCTPRRSLCHSPCGNPPAKPGEVIGAAQGLVQELAESASTVGSKGTTASSHAGTFAPSRTPTPAPAPVPALISAEELFKQFMKTYKAFVKVLEQNGGQAGQAIPAELWERPFKAKVPDVYYGRSHIDCFHFCQQCEVHFETAGAIGINRTPFAASFLRGNISVRWAQHKRKHQGERVVPISWTEFKAFFQKNLGESKSFMDSIWRKMKRDSQYQLEKVYDWASHLKHLQSILLEFDAAVAPTELTMVRYFEEALKPSIKAEMDQDADQLDSFEDLVTKAVKAEAKAGLRPSSYVRETDHHCI